MTVRWWYEPPGMVPQDADEQREWLRLQWAVVDSWIDARKAERGQPPEVSAPEPAGAAAASRAAADPVAADPVAADPVAAETAADPIVPATAPEPLTGPAAGL